MAKSAQPKNYEQRVILPLGSKEIEFTLPPAAYSGKSSLHTRRNSQKLEIPTVINPLTTLASATAEHSNSPSRLPLPTPSPSPSRRTFIESTTTTPTPTQTTTTGVAHRRFSYAFLFPNAYRSTSPLLSASIFHSSAPSSPIPACTPSPFHSPNHESGNDGPLPSRYGFFREQSSSNRSLSSRSPSPSTREQVPSPVPSRGSSPPVGSAGVTSGIGMLNPDLYKSPLLPEEDTNNYPDNHLGRVWFSLKYEPEQEKLEINLIRIHNLPSRDKEATSCDPVVRVALLPGERRYQKSSLERKTCNPVYNEEFSFCVSKKELEDQTVKFTVIDNGHPRKRQVIGHLLCSLKNLSIENDKQQIITQDLSKDPSASCLGEMHVSLCYHPTADRMTVTILQARNVKAPNSAIPDTYVRLTLFNQTRAVKTKRTGIVRRSAEPCYNESFHFRLEAACIDATNIVLAIHQPDNKDRILGRLVLGSFMFARGRGLAHWNEMLARPREHIQRWHPLPAYI